mgnify:CR=1 FL=1
MATNSGNDPHAASAERRKRLKEFEAQSHHALKHLAHNKPMDHYYNLLDRLLVAFHDALDARQLDNAYVLGFRFATFSLEQLPQHAMYKSPQFQHRVPKNAKQVQQVLEKLESVATRMDAEEMARRHKEKQRLKAKIQAKKQQLQNQMDQKKQLEESEEEKTKRHMAILQRQRYELWQAQQAERQEQSQETNPPNLQDPPQQPEKVPQALPTSKQELEQRARDKLRLLNLQTKSQREAEAEASKKATPPATKPKQDAPRTDGDAAKPATTSTWPQKQPSGRVIKTSNSVGKPKQQPAAAATTKPSMTQQAKQSSSSSISTASLKQKLLALATPKKQSSSRAQQQQQVTMMAKQDDKPKSARVAIDAPSSVVTNHTAKKNVHKPVVVPVVVAEDPHSHPSEEEGHEISTTHDGKIVVDDHITLNPEEEDEVVEEEDEEVYDCRAHLTASEAKTIQMLENTIALQERRLALLEESDQPALLRQQAKDKLSQGDRKGALHCLARKRRLDQSLDVIKHAIFNMETQVIMLESAVENRQVNDIMEEASQAMSSLQQQAGVPLEGISDERLNDILASSVGGDDVFDEEELLSELQNETGGTASSTIANAAAEEDDYSSLLSFPSLPGDPVEMVANGMQRGKGKADKAIKSVLASLF